MDHEIAAMWVWTVSYAVGVAGIVWALTLIHRDGKRRDRELDAMEADGRHLGRDRRAGRAVGGDCLRPVALG